MVSFHDEEDERERHPGGGAGPLPVDEALLANQGSGGGGGRAREILPLLMLANPEERNSKIDLDLETLTKYITCRSNEPPASPQKTRGSPGECRRHDDGGSVVCVLESEVIQYTHTKGEEVGRQGGSVFFERSATVISQFTSAFSV